jgi:hypothetical protein
MALSGITVSVGYDDLLAITLPQNLDLFDQLIVVTSETDKRTQQLVTDLSRRNTGLDLLVTDLFYRDGAIFNKFRAVEAATQRIDPARWCLILDADIFLPATTRERLAAGGLCQLNPDCLYGARRWLILRKAQLQVISQGAADVAETSLIHERYFECYQDSEIAGYFQLFHPASRFLMQRPWYGIDWRHAGGGDSDFMLKFPAVNRCWLPDCEVYHLGQPGENWFGRTDARWDELSEAAVTPAEQLTPAAARHEMTAMRRARGQNKGVDRFKGEKL